MSSSIEWTDETWNPTVGCSEVSPGCDHCYAAKVAHRGLTPAHKGLTILTGEGVKWNGTVRCLPDRLEIPLRWRRPRRVFVDSMSDLFHPEVPASFILDVFSVMARTPHHTYQVLTKRPQRMQRVLSHYMFDDSIERRLPGSVSVDWGYEYVYNALDPARFLPNVWVGTSIEDASYLWRARHLRETPAALRFLSLEPALGAIARPVASPLDLSGIGWVIVGGESGPGARACDPRWVRAIRDQCAAENVPFFFKQWGEHNEAGERVGKKAAARSLDGRTWDEFPTPVEVS